MNDHEKDFERGIRFGCIFGNGGFEYFFECDQYGQATVDSLRRLGLSELAECLAQVFAYAPPPPGGEHTIDLNRLIETKDPVFSGLEDEAWKYFKGINPALASFVRRNPGPFAHLQERVPYDPSHR